MIANTAKLLVDLMIQNLPNRNDYSASVDYHSYGGRRGQRIYLHLNGGCEAFDSYTDASNWIHNKAKYQNKHEILFRKF